MLISSKVMHGLLNMIDAQVQVVAASMVGPVSTGPLFGAQSVSCTHKILAGCLADRSAGTCKLNSRSTQR